MKKESSRAGDMIINTKSSRDGSGAMFMKRKRSRLRAISFYDGSAALVVTTPSLHKLWQ